MLHACFSLGAGDLKPGSCALPASAPPLSHVCHPAWARVPRALFKGSLSLSEQCNQGDNVALIWDGDRNSKCTLRVCGTVWGGPGRLGGCGLLPLTVLWAQGWVRNCRPGWFLGSAVCSFICWELFLSVHLFSKEPMRISEDTL